MRVTNPSRLVMRWAVGLLLNMNQYAADKTAAMLLAPSYAQYPLLRKVTVCIKCIWIKMAIDKTLQAASKQLS